MKKIELIKITLAEKIILENMPKDYRFISRDQDDKLYIYKIKPFKDGDVSKNHWVCEGEMMFAECVSHLFKFIKWEDKEPYNIKELLANCEVVEKEKENVD